MSSSDRRTFLAGAIAPVLLSGCGFTPAYAPGGSADRLDGQIRIAKPGNRTQYVFATRLEDRLGRNPAGPLQLNYSITTNREGLARTASNSTLRYHLNGTVNFRVTELASGEVLTRGSVETFTAYSAQGTTVATRASQVDAARRLMVMLADQVTTRLIATAGTWLP